MMIGVVSVFAPLARGIHDGRSGPGGGGGEKGRRWSEVSSSAPAPTPGAQTRICREQLMLGS